MNTTIAEPAVSTAPGLSDRQVINRLRKIAELKDAIRAANDAIKDLQAEIIGNAEALAVDTSKYTISYKDEGGYRIDTKALKQAHPDIVKSYQKWTPKMTFRYSLK